MESDGRATMRRHFYCSSSTDSIQQIETSLSIQAESLKFILSLSLLVNGGKHSKVIKLDQNVWTS